MKKFLCGSLYFFLVVSLILFSTVVIAGSEKEKLVGIWKSTIEKWGFPEFTLKADGTADVTDEEGKTAAAKWSLEKDSLEIKTDDGKRGSSGNIRWVSDTEFKIVYCKGSAKKVEKK